MPRCWRSTAFWAATVVQGKMGPRPKPAIMRIPEATGADTRWANMANAATAKLIQRGDELAAKGEAAPMVWALEAQTPAVAGAKLTGLAAFYAIGPDTGGEYFAVHQHLDVEHAAELRALCSEGSAAPAAAMSEALWDLLTSVEAAPQPV